jgi:tartrate dehydrogenase/decarboxylase/D-malate dehydrogenase
LKRSQCSPVATAFQLRVEHFPWSSENTKAGYYIPEGGLDQLKKFDAIFFGAVSAPACPIMSRCGAYGCRLPGLRPVCERAARARAARSQKPTRRGEGIDWVVIRENSEGEYSGSGGAQRPPEGCTETSVFTYNSVAAFTGMHSSREKTPAQTSDSRHQVQRATPRHGDVG